MDMKKLFEDFKKHVEQLVDVCDLQCRRGIFSFCLIQYLVQFHIVLSFLNQVLHYLCLRISRIFSFEEAHPPN